MCGVGRAGLGVGCGMGAVRCRVRRPQGDVREHHHPHGKVICGAWRSGVRCGGCGVMGVVCAVGCVGCVVEVLACGVGCRVCEV